MYQPSLSEEKVDLLNNLANDFRKGVDFGLQSSLYAKASQIDRPLSCSYFKERPSPLFPSFHTIRYHLVCRIYLLGRNGQIAKTGLSPIRSNILLAAISPLPLLPRAREKLYVQETNFNKLYYKKMENVKYNSL